MLGDDAGLFPFLSSVNVACGFHAGDPLTIQAAVALAMRHWLGIGAHPSYPDLPGFGRRILDATPDQVYADVLYQVSALAGMCSAAGVLLRHVKAHGALSTRAWTHAPRLPPSRRPCMTSTRRCRWWRCRPPSSNRKPAAWACRSPRQGGSGPDGKAGPGCFRRWEQTRCPAISWLPAASRGTAPRRRAVPLSDGTCGPV